MPFWFRMDAIAYAPLPLEFSSNIVLTVLRCSVGSSLPLVLLPSSVKS